SLFGMKISHTTRSQPWRWNWRRPSSPSTATVTSCPARSRMALMVLRTMSSSSMTRIRGMRSKVQYSLINWINSSKYSHTPSGEGVQWCTQPFARPRPLRRLEDAQAAQHGHGALCEALEALAQLRLVGLDPLELLSVLGEG